MNVFLSDDKFTSDEDVLEILKKHNVDENSIDKYSERLNYKHWKEISKKQRISEQFIDKYADKLYWADISSRQSLSVDFIEKYVDRLNLRSVCVAQNLSEEFLIKHKDKITCLNNYTIPNLSEQFIEENWSWIYDFLVLENGDRFYDFTAYANVSLDFIEKHPSYFDWDIISDEKVLTEEFIRRNDKLLNWWNVSRNQKLSPQLVYDYEDKFDFSWSFVTDNQIHLLDDKEFILKYIDRIDWSALAKEFSDTGADFFGQDFIEENAEKLTKSAWEYVAICETLSEPFIEKWMNKLDIDAISKYQKLSESFIDKYSKVLNWEYVGFTGEHLSERFLEKWEYSINWNQICKWKTLSENFMEKFADKINWQDVSKYQSFSPQFAIKHIGLIDIPSLNTNYRMKRNEVQDILTAIQVVKKLA